MSPPFSLLLFCSFLLEGKFQGPQDTVRPIGPVRESSTPWYICLFGLLSFFASFTEKRHSFIWSVLNHIYVFWMFLITEESPAQTCLDRSGLFPLSKFFSYKNTGGRNVSDFWECSFWLGHIWCFAVLIYSQISELSFQGCIYHIYLKEIGGTKGAMATSTL